MAQQGGNSSGQLGSMAVASLPDTDTVPGFTPFPALARLSGLRPFWNAESPAGNRWAQGLESESCGPMGPPATGTRLLGQIPAYAGCRGQGGGWKWSTGTRLACRMCGLDASCHRSVSLLG